MAAINPTDTTRYDTRGLPEGYDPHKLYEYRFAKLSENSTGLEGLAYKFIPFSLLKSFAFAIDPTAEFKVGPGVITPVNRTKYSQMASVFNIVTYDIDDFQQAQASQVNHGGISACWGPKHGFPPNTGHFRGFLANQDPLPMYLKDTTTRTRLIGSEQGELELFKFYLYSPPRSVSVSTTTRYFVHHDGVDYPGSPCIIAGGSGDDMGEGYNRRRITTSSGAVLSRGTYNALRTAEISYAKGLCSEHAISMIKGYSPFNRDYTLFRNLAELRDIPRSVLSLKDTLGNLRKLYASLSTSPSLRKIVFDLKNTSKDIPNEYLSFHFGWKQTWKDLNDLLVAPAKIAKRYNLLIKRAGKPTTFRSKRTFLSGSTDGVSGFDYFSFGEEQDVKIKSSISRESELRLVVNATFDFPPAVLPYFQFNDYLNRLGIKPRVTDVYNLVPWTWLVDWFTGFGNYVECIDNLNHDPSLINWGMLTCVTKGKLTTNLTSKSLQIVRTQIQGIDQPAGDYFIANNHTSLLDYTCQVRVDAATVLDVKTTSAPSSLTDYQKSIIGALLAQRAGNPKTHSFRVTS